jgi:hypothetical protein
MWTAGSVWIAPFEGKRWHRGKRHPLFSHREEGLDMLGQYVTTEGCALGCICFNPPDHDHAIMAVVGWE